MQTSSSSAQHVAVPVPYTNGGINGLASALLALMELQQKTEVIFRRIEKKLEVEERRADRVLSKILHCAEEVRRRTVDTNNRPVVLVSMRHYPEEAAAELLYGGEKEARSTLVSRLWEPSIADPKLSRGWIEEGQEAKEDASLYDSEEEEEYRFLHNGGTSLNDYQMDYFVESAGGGADPDKRPRPAPVMHSRKVERRVMKEMEAEGVDEEEVARRLAEGYLPPMCRVGPPEAAQSGPRDSRRSAERGRTGWEPLQQLYRDYAPPHPHHPLSSMSLDLRVPTPAETAPNLTSQSPDGFSRAPHSYTADPFSLRNALLNEQALGALPIDDIHSVSSLVKFNQKASKGGLLYGLRATTAPAVRVHPAPPSSAKEEVSHYLPGTPDRFEEGYAFVPTTQGTRPADDASHRGAPSYHIDFIDDLPTNLPGLEEVAQVDWDPQDPTPGEEGGGQGEEEYSQFLGPFQYRSRRPPSEVSSLPRRRTRSKGRSPQPKKGNPSALPVATSPPPPPPPPPPTTDLLPPPPLPTASEDTTAAATVKKPFIPAGGKPSIISIMMGRPLDTETKDTGNVPPIEEPETATPSSPFAAQLLSELQKKKEQLQPTVTQGDKGWTDPNRPPDSLTTLSTTLANRRKEITEDNEEDSSEEERESRGRGRRGGGGGGGGEGGRRATGKPPVKGPPAPPSSMPPPPPPPPPPKK